MSRDTTKNKGAQPDVHISADPVIRDYVADLRKRTDPYSMPLKEARAVVDTVLRETRLTDALYKMREDKDVV
jgi:hypothetical protein